MADWDLHAFILRRMDLRLAGANWQRGGGKGQKPKAIDLPDGKQKQAAKADGDDIAQRLRNLGLIPTGDAANPPPAREPTAGELAAEADRLWLERQQALITE